MELKQLQYVSVFLQLGNKRQYVKITLNIYSGHKSHQHTEPN